MLCGPAGFVASIENLWNNYLPVSRQKHSRKIGMEWWSRNWEMEWMGFNSGGVLLNMRNIYWLETVLWKFMVYLNSGTHHSTGVTTYSTGARSNLFKPSFVCWHWEITDCLYCWQCGMSSWELIKVHHLIHSIIKQLQKVTLGSSKLNYSLPRAEVSSNITMKNSDSDFAASFCASCP